MKRWITNPTYIGRSPAPAPALDASRVTLGPDRFPRSWTAPPKPDAIDRLMLRVVALHPAVEEIALCRHRALELDDYVRLGLERACAAYLDEKSDCRASAARTAAVAEGVGVSA